MSEQNAIGYGADAAEQSPELAEAIRQQEIGHLFNALTEQVSDRSRTKFVLPDGPRSAWVIVDATDRVLSALDPPIMPLNERKRFFLQEKGPDTGEQVTYSVRHNYPERVWEGVIVTDDRQYETREHMSTETAKRLRSLVESGQQHRLPRAALWLRQFLRNLRAGEANGRLVDKELSVAATNTEILAVETIARTQLALALAERVESDGDEPTVLWPSDDPRERIEISYSEHVGVGAAESDQASGMPTNSSFFVRHSGPRHDQQREYEVTLDGERTADDGLAVRSVSAVQLSVVQDPALRVTRDPLDVFDASELEQLIWQSSETPPAT